MIDGQRRGARLRRGDRGERNNAVARGVEIDVLQAIRALPVLGRNLQYDVILVQLSVDNGDLRLSEGAVEGLIQRLRRDAKARGGGAVIADQLLQPAILRIAVHILEAGDLLHPGKQDRTPVCQIRHAIRLYGVLVHCVALSSSDAQVLRRPK